MRLFLSSYRFGAHVDRFVELVGGPGPIAVIANAADAWPARARESAVVSDVVPLRRLGFAPTEVDLRDFVGAPDRLADTLSAFGAVWVRGGNTFVLRAQLARSGGDAVLSALIRDDRTAYAGYSAGACAMAPSLVGVDSADDPAEVLPACGIEPRWDGLGFVDFAIVPHCLPGTDGTADPAHPGDEAARMVAACRTAGVPYRMLTDDQAIVKEAGATAVL
ncbi:Type 1 glutamine amidotransferase-like domain-containing protein [Rhodococcus sp. SGAir0479]|uniref:Type 1 glutamine amidotransferase-like domain-containing protein n=1 Tax=Rhodococcus sp. SGAir0479 TaxID=2567884 RepID=UPI0010CCE9F3|nr:Type 1 glutamine amidotransferase-like domain-containing protein [Rhodococcus sp. SGAir0479]QCQ90517.1 peptidase [Rhodococcus sp. SGAir0479]